MEKLEEKTQELAEKQQKLDQTKQEPLDWGLNTASGRVCTRSMICGVISSGLASHRRHTA